MKKLLLAVLMSLLLTTGLQADHSSKHTCEQLEYAPCITISKYILRDPSVLTTASMSVDYIDQYTIENTNTIDTVQAIARATGLNVVQSGPTGQQTSVFMRGMNSNHTMVAINGVAIKDHSTTGGLHDIGSDFIKHVTGIQVVKGSQGTLYGANAVGGVINFITTDSYANSISTTTGSNNTKGLTLKIHRNIDNHSVSVIADGTTSDGISVAPSGTEKDGFDANNITINTKSTWDDVEIKTTLIRRESDADLDNGTSDDLDYTAENNMNLYQLSGKVNTGLGSYNLTFSRTEYDRDYYNGTEHDEYDSYSNTVLLTNTIQKDKWDITPGVEYEEFEGSFDNRGQYYSASVDTGGENIGYFVNGNMIVSDKLLLSAGVRQDDPSLFGDYTTHRLGGTYDLTGALQLKGNYATSVKTPTLYEMHGSDNYGYNGNPNLLPEEAVSTDLGFEFKFKESVLDFVYFSTDLDNLITYGNSTYSNASGKSNRHGAELKFNTLVSENIYWRTNATFTIAEDGNGTQVLRRPKWTGLTAVDYKKDSWTTTAEYLHTGSHLDIDSATYATITKPSVGVANFHTNYEINENSNVIFSLNNAFDKTYERPDGYAQDGRNILLTYKLKF
jgi:vitamin B12 transporter